MLKTGTSSWSKPGGKRGPSTSWSLPVDAHRRAAHVSLLARDLAGERAPREQVRADDDRIDARAEVVDVRDRDHAHPSLAESVEHPGSRAAARKRSPWPGAYSDAAPSASRKSSPDGSSRSETNWWKTSGSPSSRSATCARIASSVAKLVMSATGTVAPTRALERGGLRELRLEEAHAVDRLEHGLDDAAEARRHAAREHDLGDLAAAKRLESCGSCALVARLARALGAA